MRLTIQPRGLSVGNSEKGIRPISVLSVLSVLLILTFYRLVVIVHTAYRSESACNLFGSGSRNNFTRRITMLMLVTLQVLLE